MSQIEVLWSHIHNGVPVGVVISRFTRQFQQSAYVSVHIASIPVNTPPHYNRGVLMIVTFSEEIRDAMEVIMRAPTTDQIKVINVLLRNQAINKDIGVVGRGFLGDANQYIRAAVDYIDIGIMDSSSKGDNDA